MLNSHAAPAESVSPPAHPVLMCQPSPVAGSVDTSVNDQGALPQLLIVTFAVVLVPTSSLPKINVCWLAQNRPCAAAPQAARSRKKAMRTRFSSLSSRRACRL
jgi:hypothetical protein